MSGTIKELAFVRDQIKGSFYDQLKLSESINSIGKSFARAGIHNLVMSLWPVSYQAASSLIKEY